MNDTAKAIAAYEKLTQGNPDDTDAQLALAGLYEQVSNYDEARKRLARVRAADSKNLDALLASGRVEIECWKSAGGPGVSEFCLQPGNAVWQRRGEGIGRTADGRGLPGLEPSSMRP